MFRLAATQEGARVEVGALTSLTTLPKRENKLKPGDDTN